MLLFTLGIPYCGWEASLSLLETAGVTITTSLDLPAITNDRHKPHYRSLLSDAITSLHTSATDPETLDCVVADERLAEALEDIAISLPTARFLLFFSSFEDCLPVALTHGADPQQYAEDWAAAAHRLLQLYRKHRRRVILLDVRNAVPLMVSEAGRILGLSLPGLLLEEKTASDMGNQHVDSFVALLAAQRLLTELPDTAELRAELEACALPGLHAKTVEDAVELDMLQRYRLWNETRHASMAALSEQQAETRYYAELLAVAEAEKRELTAELERYVNEVAELQGQLNQCTQRNSEQQNLADAHIQTTQQLQISQNEQSRLTAELQDKTEENDLLLLQLHQVQEELEALFGKHGEHEQVLAELQGRLEQITVERDKQSRLAEDRRIQLESSAKEKADLVAARDQQAKLAAERQQQLEVAVKEKADLSAARDQQAKLAKNLQTVLQERDRQVLQISELESRHTTQQQELARLTAELQDKTEENDLLLLQLHQVQKELEALFAKHGEHEQVIAELQGRLEQITVERDKQSRLAEDRRIQLEATAKEKADLIAARNQQAKLAAERQQQLETAAKEKADLSAARDQQAKLAKNLQTVLQERDRQVLQISELESRHTTQQQELARLTAELQDKTEENDLLLLQLHQVQEELEALFLKEQQLLQSYEEQTCLLGTTQQELQAVVHDKNLLAFKLEQAKEGIRRLLQMKQQLLGTTQQELQQKETLIQQERRRLTKLKKTVSWKITSPLRAVVRPFGQPQAEVLQPSTPPLNSTASEVETHAIIVRASGIFNEEWYLTEYLDVAAAGIDPVQHYLLADVSEGRNPSPEFDSAYYLSANPDVAENGVNPLLHYILTGKSEGRLPVDPQGASAQKLNTAQPDATTDEHAESAAFIRESGLFDEAWYSATYPDVAQQGVDPIMHYLRRGAMEGRNPSPTFNTVFYCAAYPDVPESGINPLLHYLHCGKAEGRMSIEPGEAQHQTSEVC